MFNVDKYFFDKSFDNSQKSLIIILALQCKPHKVRKYIKMCCASFYRPGLKCSNQFCAVSLSTQY